jgi:hypothetical protein
LIGEVEENDSVGVDAVVQHDRLSSETSEDKAASTPSS